MVKEKRQNREQTNLWLEVNPNFSYFFFEPLSLFLSISYFPFKFLFGFKDTNQLLWSGSIDTATD